MNSEDNKNISEENKIILENKNNNNDSKVEINNKEILVNNKDNSQTTDNFLLNKKTKRDGSPINENINNNNNKIKKTENEKTKKEVYEYGYSIILTEDNEKGLMEEFLKENIIESKNSDFYNYNYNQEIWEEIVRHSTLVHYERHLKEEMEKRKKMQNMFMFNMNINMNMNNNIIPPSMLPQMNSLMMTNMNSKNNSLNYPIQIPSLQNINKN